MDSTVYDEFGPEKVIKVYDPASGMHGMVVIDNTSLGPGKGGIRMTPTVSEEEVFRLARTMTWKNALAGIPMGGAKSGIVADANIISPSKKRQMVEAFGRALKIVSPDHYIAAPDMNMGSTEMEWFVKANGSSRSATGKPAHMGGLPHELGSTGFGVFHSALVAAKHAAIEMSEASIAIEGFGNVGSFAAKFLSDCGCRIVAVSDSKGIIHNSKGIDFGKLTRVKKETGSVVNYHPGSKACCSDILDVNADILITAAIPDLIKPGDVERLKYKLVVEGSNIPMSTETEERLHSKGILVVPDFVANAGGVISSYVEHTGGGQKKMFREIEEKIKKNTMSVLRESKKTGKTPREAAMRIAMKRVREAKKNA